MRYFSKNLVSAAVASVITFPGLVYATNGMNLEGYGPEATAMGGASMAYDNGTAAVMNNPATLGLIKSKHRLDVALGFLGPDVSATVTTPNGKLNADSSGTAYFMPALGWVKKTGSFAFGFGVFGQGGMGTEYSSTSWLADPSQGTNTALTSGLVNRSEVGVGRAILPLVFNLSDKVSIGGSVDFVWAGMDLQMAMSEAQFQNVANPQAQTIGTASGSLVDSFGQLYEPFGAAAGIAKLHHAYFDFSNDSDFTGEAMGTGFAGKIGIAMQLTKKLSIGATYHSKTRLSDLETSNATMSMAVNADGAVLQGQAPTGTYTDMDIPVTGKITVNNFEWPEMVAFGVALRPIDDLLLVADFKRIGWASVMEEFSMTFEADSVAANGGFGGKVLDVALLQKWEDQTVIALGAGYNVSDALAVRLGYNHASNPIPDQYLNALFPAIVEDHVTAGIGFKFLKGSSVDLSVQKALEVEFTNPGNGSTIPPVTSTHSQLSWQLMYSLRY
jgi:long-chain fatty acid transport protein